MVICNLGHEAGEHQPVHRAPHGHSSPLRLYRPALRRGAAGHLRALQDAGPAEHEVHLLLHPRGDSDPRAEHAHFKADQYTNHSLQNKLFNTIVYFLHNNKLYL